MSIVRVVIRTVAKAGRTPDQNQDRTRILWAGIDDLRVGVSDGATQSHAPGLWADLLAQASVDGRLDARHNHRQLTRGVTRLATEWSTATKLDLDAPWYVREHAKRGAHATLVAMRICREKRRWVWHALCVGDTVVLHVGRDGSLIRAFPLSHSAQFNSTPRLLSTLPEAGGGLRRRRLRTSGWLRTGESLWIATDALAAFLLAHQEAGLPIGATLIPCVRSDKAFARTVERLRSEGRLADDDTTVVGIRHR